MILKPDFLKFLVNIFDDRNIINVINNTIIRDMNKVILSIELFASDDNIIIDAIEPGPAINGTPKGL